VADEYEYGAPRLPLRRTSELPPCHLRWQLMVGCLLALTRLGAEPRLSRCQAAARRATERQILEDADHLIALWNERQAKQMPMLFSPTIGAAITAGYWFRARCPACRTTGDVDLRTLDWHRGAAVNPGAVVSLLPAERAVCRTAMPIKVQRAGRFRQRVHRQQMGRRVLMTEELRGILPGRFVPFLFPPRLPPGHQRLVVVGDFAARRGTISSAERAGRMASE
jgi:hypothetical protein